MEYGQKNNKKHKRFLPLLYNRMLRSKLSNNSAVIAFYFMLSLIPLLVVITTLIPYFRVDPASIAPYVYSMLPEPVYNVIMPLISNLLTQTSGGMLSLGIVGTIWSASKVIKHIQSGIYSAFGVENGQRYIFSRIISVATLILILLACIILTLFFSFGEYLFAYFQVNLNYTAVKVYIPLVAIFGIIALIYYTTPGLKLSLKQILPGSILSTVFLFFSIKVFALYLNYSIQPFTASGTISSMFILLIWMQLIGYILLTGAALNAAIYAIKYDLPPVRENKKKQPKQDNCIFITENTQNPLPKTDNTGAV